MGFMIYSNFVTFKSLYITNVNYECYVIFLKMKGNYMLDQNWGYNWNNYLIYLIYILWETVKKLCLKSSTMLQNFIDKISVY